MLCFVNSYKNNILDYALDFSSPPLLASLARVSPSVILVTSSVSSLCSWDPPVILVTSPVFSLFSAPLSLFPTSCPSPFSASTGDATRRPRQCR